MITLALDASTYVGTVAVIADGVVVAEQSVAMRDRQQERLMPAVDAAARAAGIELGRIERIICGGGPGSFTSLRIAASIAKGLATGLDRPLFSVSSLALIVAGNGGLAGQRYLATLDALRGEAYVAEFLAGETIRQLSPVRTVPVTAIDSQSDREVTVVGPDRGAGWAPHARGAGRVQDLDGPVNLAAWEPEYGRAAEAQVRWEAEQGRPLTP